MNVLKQFWFQFVASITNLNFYRHLIEKPTRLVLAYFYGATILFGLGSAAWLQWYVLPQVSKHAAAVQTELIASLPSDQGIRVNNQQLQLVTYDATGAATIAQRELRVPSPPSLPRLLFIPASQLTAWNKAWPAHLLIVSPTTISTPADYLASLNTTSLLLIDQSGVYIFDGESWERTSFDKTEANQSELTMKQLKDEIVKWSDVIRTTARKYLYLVWPVTFVGIFISHTVMLSWYSLLTFLVCKAFSYQLNYRDCLKITAYIAVVAQCIAYITQAIYPWFGIDMFGISYWAICLYVLYVLKTSLSKPIVAAS